MNYITHAKGGDVVHSLVLLILEALIFLLQRLHFGLQRAAVGAGHSI